MRRVRPREGQGPSTGTQLMIGGVGLTPRSSTFPSGPPYSVRWKGRLGGFPPLEVPRWGFVAAHVWGAGGRSWGHSNRPWPWVPEPLSDQAGVCESVARGGPECLTSRVWTGCSSAVCLTSTQSTQMFPSFPPTFLPFLLPSSLIHSALAWICYVPCP